LERFCFSNNTKIGTFLFCQWQKMPLNSQVREWNVKEAKLII
jgi:hypothetical protein